MYTYMKTFAILPQNLVEEQQSQLNQYECAAGQCVSELQKAQLQVQSLQAKIHESEANNMVHLLLPLCNNECHESVFDGGGALFAEAAGEAE